MLPHISFESFSVVYKLAYASIVIYLQCQSIPIARIQINDNFILAFYATIQQFAACN